jgi:hypothetical protein
MTHERLDKALVPWSRTTGIENGPLDRDHVTESGDDLLGSATPPHRPCWSGSAPVADDLELAAVRDTERRQPVHQVVRGAGHNARNSLRRARPSRTPGPWTPASWRLRPPSPVHVEQESLVQ